MVLDPSDVAKAVALAEDGRSIRYISNALGYSRSAIHRALVRYRETNSFTRRPGSGRKRATTVHDDRFLRLSALRNRHLTAVSHKISLQRTRNVQVSVSTVQRRLHEANLHAKRPLKGPELEVHHRRTRLEFVQNHIDWNEDNWGKVLFTDESKFNLRFADGRLRVWRRVNERYAECTFTPKVPFGGGGFLVWGGVSMDARTDLVFIENGSLTAERYIEEILLPHVLPYAPFIGDEFILMQDNARPHAARIVRGFFDEVEITAMDWPPRSPDLNPIEHVWDMLGRRIRSRQPPPETLNELRDALTEEWNAIPQDSIRELIRSMHRRLQAVRRARGGNTRY